MVENYNPKPKRKFGQNFLTETYYAERIANSVDCKEGTVLEIGPGKGALSVYLKERYPKNFEMIEMDREIIPILESKLGDGNWKIHQGSALDFDFKTLKSPLHIIGNLPYNTAAHIIKRSLLNSPATASVNFMVQREVAERICAKPGGRKIGFLSIFCSFFGTPKILFHVPRGAFSPKPNVDSSVFTLAVNPNVEEQLPKDEWLDFFTYVSLGYSMRRKVLSKVLAWKRKNRAEVIVAIESLGLKSTVRAEELSVELWVKLYKICGRV